MFPNSAPRPRSVPLRSRAGFRGSLAPGLQHRTRLNPSRGEGRGAVREAARRPGSSRDPGAPRAVTCESRAQAGVRSTRPLGVRGASLGAGRGAAARDSGRRAGGRGCTRGPEHGSGRRGRSLALGPLVSVVSLGQGAGRSSTYLRRWSRGAAGR